MNQADLDVGGLFLNADAGFDTAEMRSVCAEHQIEANIPCNPRNNPEHYDRDEYFDDELYKRRTVIEHTFAWLDGFKGLLVRYETKLKSWAAVNIMGFIILFVRKIPETRKC